jgi:hypothetical protein
MLLVNTNELYNFSCASKHRPTELQPKHDYSSQMSINKHMLSFMLAQQHHVVCIQYVKYASNMYMRQT